MVVIFLYTEIKDVEGDYILNINYCNYISSYITFHNMLIIFLQIPVFISSSVESTGSKHALPNVSRLSLSQSSHESPEEPICRQGTSGVKFEAVTNWIPLLVDSSKVAYEYSVQFKPPVDSMNLRSQLLNSQRAKIGHVKSFDGAKLWLPTLLPKQVTEFETQSKSSGENFRMSISFITKLSMLQCVQLYNVLFNRIMKVLKYVMIGRNVYSPHESVMIPQHQLEIWPGYITAVHHMEKGVMLGDIATYKKGNFKQEALKCLVGNIVLTRYNNKCYRIDDIVFDSSPNSTFVSSRGQEVRYVLKL
ncbi:hypothetical protein Anas_06940 [Armadillidium nasatum]|uniref:PAZ domain-containing protein n=1 Tax=Armadillidium nasatum TaxID=96803 RepID=A0A5N5TKN7_9CRUS|nr:hypothetical protein Anas_06940 [Armadillidium nasatum]